MDTHDYNVALGENTETEDDLEKEDGGEELEGLEKDPEEEEDPGRYDLGVEEEIE